MVFFTLFAIYFQLFTLDDYVSNLLGIILVIIASGIAEGSLAIDLEQNTEFVCLNKAHSFLPVYIYIINVP